MIKKLLAFSLIEVLLSLIIVSSIATAFAPTVTKKLNKNSAEISNSIKTHCGHTDPVCTLCRKNVCYACLKDCGVNQYKKVDSCECGNCSDGCVTCTSDGCTRCDAGYYWKSTDKTCVECPDGTYQQSAGQQASCADCPVDYECTKRDKTHCSPGYGSDLKSTTCSLCSTKIDSNCVECANTSECTECKKGYYINDTGGCTICPANHYCDGKVKKQCPPSKVSNEGAWECGSCSSFMPNCANCQSATKCDACEQGYYKSSESSCDFCPCGNKCDGTSKTACTGTTYQPSTKQTGCEMCPEGQESDTSKGGCSCKLSKCEAGLYKNGGTCVPCDIDNECNNGETKTPCTAGKGANAGSPTCYACSSYITGCTECTDLSTCTACNTTGYYLNGKTCACSTGYYESNGVCVPCPTGCASCTSSSSCSSCLSGYFKSGSSCITCGAGQYYTGSGCASCTKFGDKCTACDSSGCLPEGCEQDPNYYSAVYAPANTAFSSDVQGKYVCAKCTAFWCQCGKCKPNASGCSSCWTCKASKGCYCNKTACS